MTDFESLGPERFQEFCQALLLSQFPDLQCFPVGQPDGGRDAASRGADNATLGTIVQVKYRRKDEEESAPWMISALQKELPKILHLIERGATSYVMVTNASGTSHEDVGRIDRVQAWLDEHVPIKAICLWRDDLDRRLEASPDGLKLSYPSLLSGEDALILIVEALMGPQRERVSRVLRAFVSAQYSKDEEVKFRQVELANSLLGLFVDVPLDLTDIYWGADPRAHSQKVRSIVSRIARNAGDRSGLDEPSSIGPRMVAGTADFLLNPEVQANIPWVILQGAPGQGKSTLAQYVCQVHRARFLNRSEFLEGLEGNHSSAAFRLPIKVDLRDLASYLSGKPFLGLSGPLADKVQTFERFLAAAVSIQSGGLDFSADDLAGTLSTVPSLIFLDGLDEVADVEVRKLLVVSIVEGLGRLKENGADVQVVVTTRPSLFGRAPALPKSFARFTLAPIGLQTINAYTAKWVIARRLEAERAGEVREILKQKLGLSHIRELTRNPMQLTILLSLIHSVGYSLPDVRTDLYRQYVDLFMTREAEKSKIVQLHKPLLLEIVEHLGWILQSEAESDRASGSISREDLKLLVRRYLTEGQHDLDILEDLFEGGLERVYVLVQRIEGLYEFEVQPLREYFAAKYLYSSAPVGSFRLEERNGDRAHRFEAMAVNPYWANVTRFYAGFYEGGEIGSLGASLKELIGSPDPAVGYIARSLGAALLTDWVFRGKKAIQNDVIDLVFDPLGVELASQGFLSGVELASLPKECGRDRLAAILFEDHVVGAKTVTRELCLFLRRNGGPESSMRFKEWIESATGAERSARIEISAACGAVAPLESLVLEELMKSDDPDEVEYANRLGVVVDYSPSAVTSNEMTVDAINQILDWGGRDSQNRRGELSILSEVLSGEFFGDTNFLLDLGLDVDPSGDPPVLAPGRRVLRSIQSNPAFGSGRLNREESPWEDPEVWDQLIETTRAEFGERWCTFWLAATNVGLVKASVLKSFAQTQLDAGRQTLFVEALSARASLGTIAVWDDRLNKGDDLNRLYWLSFFLAWASSKQILGRLSELEDLVNNLSVSNYQRLTRVLKTSMQNRRFRGGRERSGVPVVDGVSERFAHTLLDAFGEPQRMKFPASILGLPSIARRARGLELINVMLSFPGWASLSSKQAALWLDRLRELRSLGLDIPAEASSNFYAINSMPADVVNEVFKSPFTYPVVISGMATTAALTHYKAPAVRATSEAAHWVFS